jgi:two-component system LytT family response regulator
MLVDDEPSANEGMVLRLKAFSDISVIGSHLSVKSALKQLNSEMPDVILLDIEMPAQSGFDLVKQLQPETAPLIVFVTAYKQFAISAFEANAVDYLLKPTSHNRLQQTIHRLRQQILLKEPRKGSLLNVTAALDSETKELLLHQDKLVLNDNKTEINFVEYQDILWVDAAGDYVCVHTHCETYITRIRLKTLIEQMLPSQFIRIHKSTIVNIQFLSKLVLLKNSEYLAYLTNEKQLKVSRTYSKALKQLLHKQVSST